MPKAEEAVVDVIRKAANPNRKTRAAWDRVAAAAGVVVKAAVKAVEKADGVLNRSTFAPINAIKRR